MPHGGLYGSLRDLQLRGDFFVRETLQDTPQHGLVAVRQCRSLGSSSPIDGPEQRSQVSLFHENLATCDLSDGVAESAGGMVLVEDSGDTRLNKLDSLLIAHSSGDNEDLTSEAAATRAPDEIEGSFDAQIDVQQNHSRVTPREQGEAIGSRAHLPGHREIRFFIEHPRQSIPEHGVIVYQEQTDNVRHQVTQSYSPANSFFNQAV
jgi:hypothetical protein